MNSIVISFVGYCANRSLPGIYDIEDQRKIGIEYVVLERDYQINFVSREVMMKFLMTNDVETLEINYA